MTPRCGICGGRLWFGWYWEHLSPLGSAGDWRPCCRFCGRLYSKSDAWWVRRCVPRRPEWLRRLRAFLGLAR